MTHPSPSTLPPHLYRSECFAEDLAEADTPSRPSRNHRHFPFPIAAYPASPMPFEPERRQPAAARAVTTTLSRGLRRVVACAALAAATLPGSAWAGLVSYT